MVSKKLRIVNKQGFHMRPASDFSSQMSKFPCKITIKTLNGVTDGKSLMNLIAAGIKYGNEIEIICNGEMEEQALEKAVEMVENGFGEE